jgi:hypothetical protein
MHQVKRVPLNIGNDKGKVPIFLFLSLSLSSCSNNSQQATVAYTVTCFPATDDVSSAPAVSVPTNSLPPPPVPSVADPSSNAPFSPPAPPMPREQFAAAAAQPTSESRATGSSGNAISPPAAPASIAESATHSTSAHDGAIVRPAAPVVKPSAPKSAVKLNHSQDNTDQRQLLQVDVNSQDLHNLQLDDIRSFDRDSLLRLSTILLSRQHASGGNELQSASATESSADTAQLQATVAVLKVRASCMHHLHVTSS